MRTDCEDCGKIIEESELLVGPYNNMVCEECYVHCEAEILIQRVIAKEIDLCVATNAIIKLCERFRGQDKIVDNHDTPCNNSDNPIQSGGQE